MSRVASLQHLLERWRTDPSIAPNIVAWHVLPEQAARTVPFPAALHPAVSAALKQLGISALYPHQAEAFGRALQGENVLVVAPSASGKSLCYHLPILHTLLNEPSSRALYLFPTKALAQDQTSALQRLIAALPAEQRRSAPAVALYDGDTPTHQRPGVRQRASLLVTNPDMLHMGILPHHPQWSAFFQGLRYVVLDEAHVYRGVFGAHLANLLRRLRRVAAFYGGQPQFLLTTATLGNPAEFAARLIEQPVTLIEGEGAGRGRKHFLIVNPPFSDERLGLRRSALEESVRLADDLLAAGVQSLLFGRSRRSVEWLLRALLASPGACHTNATDPRQALRAYRSGYLPAERRAIERGLRQGEVRLVAATNALELGVDIGGMGAVILVGYPGSVAATWQQAGRAGRGLEEALVVLVTTADPLDQYLAHHPHFLLERPPEQALLDPDNPLLLLAHLRCAAYELPFRDGEGFGLLPPEEVAEWLDFLVQQRTLYRAAGRTFWAAEPYPAQGVSLRSTAAETVLLQTAEGGQRRLIGEVDRPSAPWLVHPGAIYLHQAQTYLVEHLDLEQNVALLRPEESEYYTLPVQRTQLDHCATHAHRQCQGLTQAWGEIRVTQQVTAFRRLRWYTQEILDTQPLDLPPSEMLTTACWLALDESLVAALREANAWRNDPNDYGPNWAQQRERARRRDGYRCQVCGAPEGDRSHDVHHRLPFRLFPSYEQANRLENLVTLCFACHQRAEKAVRVRSGLAGLGYLLGHLAPLFLMCDRSDLGVHSDPASPLAEGKPLVALYDQVPGGIGLSPRLYLLLEQVIEAAAERVATCPCAEGCPSCVGPAGFGLPELSPPEAATFGGKRETEALLKAILQSLQGTTCGDIL